MRLHLSNEIGVLKENIMQDVNYHTQTFQEEEERRVSSTYIVVFFSILNNIIIKTIHVHSRRLFFSLKWNVHLTCNTSECNYNTSMTCSYFSYLTDDSSTPTALGLKKNFSTGTVKSIRLIIFMESHRVELKNNSSYLSRRFKYQIIPIKNRKKYASFSCISTYSSSKSAV